MNHNPRATIAARPPMQRLSRAAIYALGATSIALTGCESHSMPSYGAPPIPYDGASGDDANDEAGDFSHDAGPIVDAADVGPPIDAANDTGNDASKDAENDAVPIVDAPDGEPPVDAGTD